jgi:hypothetical protein
LVGFTGLKLAHDTGVCSTFRDIHKVEIRDEDRFLFDEPGTVGSGGNSGFQAVNIAAQFGATRIMLIGFDMHSGGGLHWYGRNRWHSANNPSNANLMHWRDVFTAQAPHLKARGIEVVNASPDSALVCFERGSIEDTLAAWQC